MSRTVTIGGIRDRARERADMVGSLFLTDAEFNKLIDAAYTELVDLLVKNEIHQFESVDVITTTTDEDTYALPTDYYKTLAMEWVYTSAQNVNIPELTFAERNKYSNQVAIGAFGSRAGGYRIVNSSVVFSPVPPAGQQYRHIYVPAPAEIAGLADDTAIDGIAGWDEFLVILVAIKAKIKEESDVSELRKDEMIFRDRIAQMSVDRSQVQEVGETHDYGERVQDDWYGFRWYR